MDAKMLVNDLDMERQVLGILLNYNQVYEEAQDRLQPKMFYNPKSQIIYEKIGELISHGEKADVVSLWAYISQHPAHLPITIDEILSLDGRYDASTFSVLCDCIVDMYKRRELYRLGMRLVAEGTAVTTDPLGNVMEEAIDDIRSLSDDSRVSIVSARDALQALEKIVQGNASGERKNGVPTGFTYFDSRGGFQRTELIIIAGRSGNGKTSLAMDMAINHAKNGYGVAYFSMEMPYTQLMARGIAAESGISSMAIMRYALTEHQWKQYDRGVGALESLPLYFDENPHSNVDRIINSIRTMVHKKGIAGAYVDYLQILSTNERGIKSEEQFYGTVARRFKDLALELNIFIVLLSQINRNKGKEETYQPTVDQLRGSGQINEAADLTILVYRPEVYDESYADYPTASTLGTAEIIIGKGRHIGQGEFLAEFDGRTTHFKDIIGNIPLKENDPVPENPQAQQLEFDMPPF